MLTQKSCSKITDFCKQEQIDVGNSWLLKKNFLDVCWRVNKGSRACTHQGQSYFQSCGVLQNLDFNSVRVLTLTLNVRVQGKIVKITWVRVLPCHEPTPSWKVADLFEGRGRVWPLGHGFSSPFALCSCWSSPYPLSFSTHG